MLPRNARRFARPSVPPAALVALAAALVAVAVVPLVPAGVPVLVAALVPVAAVLVGRARAGRAPS